MQPQEELEQLLARQEALKQELKAQAKKSFRMPSDANATTCRNRSGALKPVSPPPNASAAPAA